MFSSQPLLGVGDAVICRLQRAYSHLDDGGGTARTTSSDFSWVFSTIQPQLLSEKLWMMGVRASTASWITDYLTVCLFGLGCGGKGTVLSAFLFTGTNQSGLQVFWWLCSCWVDNRHEDKYTALVDVWYCKSPTDNFCVTDSTCSITATRYITPVAITALALTPGWIYCIHLYTSVHDDDII